MYTAEFKPQALDLLACSGKTALVVAKAPGFNSSNLAQWHREAVEGEILSVDSSLAPC
jgi:transposase-like protein